MEKELSQLKAPSSPTLSSGMKICSKAARFTGRPVQITAWFSFPRHIRIKSSACSGCFDAALIPSNVLAQNTLLLCPFMTEEELRRCIEAMDTPYIENRTLEDAVYEEGGGYLQGKRSLDETLTAIEKRIALYMAE